MESIAEPQGIYYNDTPVFSNFGFDDNVDLDDGWYQIVYKHTGKAVEFTVTISNVPGKGTFTQTKNVTLKANAYFQIDFFIP